MTIEEIKRALVETKKICNDYFCSQECPLVVNGECPVGLRFPLRWLVDDWKEEA